MGNKKRSYGSLTPSSPSTVRPSHAQASPQQQRASKQPRTGYDTQPTHARPGSSQIEAILIDDDDDDGGDDASQEVQDASQSYNETEMSWVLYGEMDAKIVGVRYYTGEATVGELALARREPNNPYDSRLVSGLAVQNDRFVV